MQRGELVSQHAATGWSVRPVRPFRKVRERRTVLYWFAGLIVSGSLAELRPPKTVKT